MTCNLETKQNRRNSRVGNCKILQMSKICIYTLMLPKHGHLQKYDPTILFHTLSAKTYDRMQKLQNKSLRICLQRQNSCNIRQLHKDSNVNYIKDRREVNLVNFMYKRKVNDALLHRGARPLRRYDANIFIEHQSQINNFESSVILQGASKWNSLAVEERRIITHDGFKQRQKEKLRNLLLAM